MKKKLLIITFLVLSAAVLCLSSCLKDNRYVDFANAGTIVDFNLGGLAYFGQDAITETPDSDANGTIVRQFAVTVASSTPPKTATVVTLAIDNTLIDARNAADTAVKYIPLPSNAYSFTTTTVTIPAGQTTAIASIKFYKNLLNSATSYMLPVRIVKAPYTISSNMGIHYFHFIGNVFAGSYLYDYTRTPAAGNFIGHTATLNPVTPNQFEAFSSYYTGLVRYEVTFDITGTGASATYSNFQVSLNSDDVASQLTANKISVTSAPKIIAPGYDPSKQYTYAQAVTLFDFKYSVLGSSGSRIVEDKFYH